MFLNFQTQADIRGEIIAAFGQLKRPATMPEIASAIWFSSAIDGTRKGVNETVRLEMTRMIGEGLLEPVELPHNKITSTTYFRPDLLTRLSFIKD